MSCVLCLVSLYPHHHNLSADLFYPKYPVEKSGQFALVKAPLLFFLVAGCATVPKQRAAKIYLKDLCERHGVQWLWDSVSLVITLRSDDLEAKALTGSDIVIIGTEKIL